MNNIRLGFDLDKVFINYPPLVPTGLIDYLYRDHQKKELSYRIPNSHAEQLIRRLTHFILLRPPIKENILFLKHLSKYENLQIFLISSRYKFLEKTTYQILKRYQIFNCFKKIYLNIEDRQPHLFKEKIIRELNLDIYIDDDLDLLKYVSSRISKPLFFWYNPNQSAVNLNGYKLIPIKDLCEITQYLTT